MHRVHDYTTPLQWTVFDKNIRSGRVVEQTAWQSSTSEDGNVIPMCVPSSTVRGRSRPFSSAGNHGGAGELVGCVAVERSGADELEVRALTVPDDEAAALLDALSNVVTAERLLAETDETGAAVYTRAGFTAEPLPEGRFRCIREIDAAPASVVAVAATTLATLEAAIRAAWSRETSDDPDEWSEENPARGQCAVTALLIRELLGGDILIANVLRGGKRVERHAWNRLPSGITLDLTREQFRNSESLTEPSVEEPLITHRHPERYEALAARVRAALG